MIKLLFIFFMALTKLSKSCGLINISSNDINSIFLNQSESYILQVPGTQVKTIFFFMTHSSYTVNTAY